MHKSDCECEECWEADALDFESCMDEAHLWFKPPYTPEPNWPGGWITVQ